MLRDAMEFGDEFTAYTDFIKAIKPILLKTHKIEVNHKKGTVTTTTERKISKKKKNSKRSVIRDPLALKKALEIKPGDSPI